MRNTIFYRVSGCLSPAGKVTSVCLKQNDLPALERLAYNDRATVNNTIRAASRSLNLLSNRSADSAQNSRSWSEAVVSRARAQLAGNYQPAKAAELEARAIAELERDIDAALGLAPADSALAAENNAAWTAAI